MKVRGLDIDIVDEVPSTAFLHANIDTWEQDTFDVIDAFVNGGVFVDIGAHVGVFSLYAAPRAKYVIAVEPDPVAFDMLERNIAANGATNITAINAAVWDRGGQVLLRAHEEGLGSSMTGPSRTGKAIFVDAITPENLAGYFEGQTIDLIKVDTEGSETHIVPGILGWDAPIHLSLHIAEMDGPISYGDRNPQTLVDHPNYPVVWLP